MLGTWVGSLVFSELFSSFGEGRGGKTKPVDQSNGVLLAMTWTEFNMPPCLRGGRPFGSVEVVLVVLGWVGTWSCHHQLMSDD